MLNSECPNCGHAVPVFASSCGACGVQNGARLGAYAVAGSLMALLVAIGFVVAVILRGQQQAGGPQDYAWLSGAMTDCDGEAANITARETVLLQHGRNLRDQLSGKVAAIEI